ncbi:sensor histidine kinase [Egicoccus sp. AB-alg2]|uniref:sensor histidine kinase n=1 Tax=Egicoccus sp. AB-alg2 TaxID=3242693 RepID=UPI00359DBC3F
MRQRLLVSAVALVMTALLAFALPLAWSVRGLLEGRAVDSLQSTAEPFGFLLDTSRNCPELQLRVVQLRDLAVVVSVITVEGGLVATTAPDGRPSIGPEVAEAGAGVPGRAVGDGRVAVGVPLSTQVCGQPVLLHMVADDATLRAQVRGAWLLIAGVAAAVAATAAGVAWLVGRRLAKPFERLATSAGRLGDGDFSARAPRSGLPEADRIADALDDTAARLGRSVDRANAFAADASHQLRTPLTALRLHLETLAAAQPGPSVDAALEEADRLERTIDELVALTRPDTAARELDLATLVRDRLPVWEDLAEQRGRNLVFEALPVPPVRVRPGAVGQALQVLLDNALRHATGTITVRLAPALPDEPDGAVRVCVLDEGPVAVPAPAPTEDGLPARVDDDPAAAGGRGLPLARALIHAEGGELSIAIGPDGSTACLLLPGARARP